MDRAEETRMWIYGTECTLRPITAKKYLEARNEGALLAEQFGGSEAARTLSLYACLIAKGAYEEDDPLFENGEAVLNALEAGEILEIAKNYEEAELKQEPEDDAESDGGETRRAPGTEEAETQLWLQPVKVQHTDTPEAEREPKDMGNKPEIRQDNGARGRADRTWSTGEITPFMQNEIINSPESAPLQTGSERMRLYKISACIERDSRRYDNGFVRY